MQNNVPRKMPPSKHNLSFIDTIYIPSKQFLHFFSFLLAYYSITPFNTAPILRQYRYFFTSKIAWYRGKWTFQNEFSTLSNHAPLILLFYKSYPFTVAASIAPLPYYLQRFFVSKRVLMISSYQINHCFFCGPIHSVHTVTRMWPFWQIFARNPFRFSYKHKKMPHRR